MKTYKVFFLIIFFSLTLLCCTNNTLTNDGDRVLSHVYSECVFDWSERGCSNMHCLSYVNKETRVYTNGDKEVWLRFVKDNDDYDSMGQYQTFACLNEKEISDMEAFVDSCITSYPQDGSYWQMRLSDGSFFYYDYMNKSIVYYSDVYDYVFLKIKAERLKGILELVRYSDSPCG